MCGICQLNASYHPECPLDGRQEMTAAEVSSSQTGVLPSKNWDEAAEQITRWGDKWDDENTENGNAFGTAGTVTYGYLLKEGNTQLPALTEAEIANVELAIANFEEISNLDFTRVQDAGSDYVANAADVEMGIQAKANTNGGWMSGSHYDGTFHSATIAIGERDLEDLGSWAFKTALHEIGHAIGMPHPGDYNGSVGDGKSYFEDSIQFSVMSYFDGADTGADFGHGWYGQSGSWVRGVWQPNGLMLHDIAAVQRLYGKNMETRTGDSTYGWNSNLDSEIWSVTDWADNMIAAIWDAGGEDTIDASGYTTDSVIDLREEAFSSMGAYEWGETRLLNNVAIARDVKIENAIGGIGDDLLIGNAADAAHHDSASTGYSGNNILDGGLGADTVSYAASGTQIIIDLEMGGARLEGYSYDLGANGVDTLRSIENLIGSAVSDRLRTASEGGTLSGEGGNDILLGRTGQDDLSGDDGNDHLRGMSGDDALNGGAGRDFLRGGLGADRIDGGDGIDWADYVQSRSAVEIDLSAGIAQGGDATGDTLISIERVRGSAFGDELTGDSGANLIRGEAGNDVLRGGAGNDKLQGGAGADTLDGGSGYDWASYFLSKTSVRVDLESGVAEGGEAQDDSFVSIERLDGSKHDDLLSGDAARNYLKGNDGADALNGREGADILRGGKGDDVLTGGSGRDTFLFAMGDGSDAVMDFEQGQDVLRFLNGVFAFDELTLSDGGDHARVEFESGAIALMGVDFASLGADDFTFA